MKKNVPADWNTLSKEYQDTKPIAERFCVEITSQLYALANKENLSLGFPVEHRVKKFDSIQSKVERLHLSLKSIQDLHDLIGVRLIFLFRRDVEKACDLITKTFQVIKKENTEERLKADQFGYSSIHFIIQLPSEWLTLPTLSQLGGLKAEIQIRSVAQHIWAASSHLLQYKKEKSVPVPIRRAIHRVSALLETVDLEFERLLEQREIYREAIDTSIHDAELNVDLVEKILDEYLPMKNKIVGDEDYAEFLHDLSQFNIVTVKELQDVINAHLKEALEDDKNQVKERIGEEDYYDGNIDRILNDGVFFSHIGLARSVLQFEFGEDWKNYMTSRYTNSDSIDWDTDVDF